MQLWLQQKQLKNANVNNASKINNFYEFCICCTVKCAATRTACNVHCSTCSLLSSECPRVWWMSTQVTECVSEWLLWMALKGRLCCCCCCCWLKCWSSWVTFRVQSSYTHKHTHAYSCVGAPQLASRIKQEGANAPFDFLWKSLSIVLQTRGI